MTDAGAHIIMEALVHSAMLELIGVQKEQGTDGRRIIVLPDPLGIGEGLRFTSDGKRQWNPNWRQEGSSTLNTLFLESVVDQIVDKSTENVCCHPTHDRNHLQRTICR
jgi:hypothetical protein